MKVTIEQIKPVEPVERVIIEMSEREKKLYHEILELDIT